MSTTRNSAFSVCRFMEMTTQVCLLSVRKTQLPQDLTIPVGIIILPAEKADQLPAPADIEFAGNPLDKSGSPDCGSRKIVR